jgi:hypothetical protein
VKTLRAEPKPVLPPPGEAETGSGHRCLADAKACRPGIANGEGLRIGYTNRDFAEAHAGGDNGDQRL